MGTITSQGLYLYRAVRHIKMRVPSTHPFLKLNSSAVFNPSKTVNFSELTATVHSLVYSFISHDHAFRRMNISRAGVLFPAGQDTSFLPRGRATTYLQLEPALSTSRTVILVTHLFSWSAVLINFLSPVITICTTRSNNLYICILYLWFSYVFHCKQ